MHGVVIEKMFSNLLICKDIQLRNISKVINLHVYHFCLVHVQIFYKINFKYKDVNCFMRYLKDWCKTCVTCNIK